MSTLYKNFSFLLLVTLCIEGCTLSHDKNNIPIGKTPTVKPTNCAWHHLRTNFTLNDASDQPAVINQTQWIAQNKVYLKHFIKKSQPYLHYILNKMKENKFPGGLALLPMIESTYDPFAYSKAGAAGLWQMMPGTATGFGVKQNWWYDGRRDLIDSTNAAIKYLHYLTKFFNGDWLLALAAYNSGEGTVKKAMRKNIKAGKNADFWSLDLPKQTQDYVPRLLALTAIIKNPSKYGVSLPEFHSKPYFGIVEIGSQIDLNIAATLSEIDISEIYLLNSGYNRWLTHPKGPHKLLLPLNKVQVFKNNFIKVSSTKHLSLKHTVKKGESLYSLAKKYNTPIAIIKKLNKLASSLIKINQELIIPTSNKVTQKTYNQNTKKPHTLSKYGPQKVIYTARSNETFSKIAKKFNVSISSIEFWNKISHHKALKIGQKIIIWHKKSKLTHMVKSGDMLSKIAYKYNTTIKHIMSLNKLASADQLKLGTELIIVA